MISMNFKRLFFLLICYSGVYSEATKSDSVCRTEEISFIETQGRRWIKDLIALHRDTTQTECQSDCWKSGECAGFVWWPGLKECELRRSSPTEGAKLIEQPESVHFHKICISAIHGTCENSFKRSAQSVLIGAAINFLTRASLEYCMAACLDAGQQCKSIVYFHEELNCLINNSTKTDTPEKFESVEPEDNIVDYYEVNCNGDWSEWSAWSDCGEVRRERTCSDPSTGCEGPRRQTTKCVSSENSPQDEFDTDLRLNVPADEKSELFTSLVDTFYHAARSLPVNGEKAPDDSEFVPYIPANHSALDPEFDERRRAI